MQHKENEAASHSAVQTGRWNSWLHLSARTEKSLNACLSCTLRNGGASQVMLEIQRECGAQQGVLNFLNYDEDDNGKPVVWTQQWGDVGDHGEIENKSGSVTWVSWHVEEDLPEESCNSPASRQQTKQAPEWPPWREIDRSSWCCKGTVESD